MLRKKLIDMLDVVGLGLERNNVIPQYDYFYFIDKHVFAGHEPFTVMAGPIPFGETIAVHGPTLLSMLKAGKSVDASLKVEGSALNITFSEHSEYNIPFEGPEKFMWKRPEMNNNPTLEGLGPAIAGCLITCSTDVALEGFNRICLADYKGKVAAYSCDGDRLTRYVTEISSKSLPDPICISRDFAEAIVKVSNGKSRLIFGKEDICAHAIIDEDVRTKQYFHVYGKNLGPPTVDYEKHIQKHVGEGAIHGLVALPHSKSLSECLEKASVVANIETSPTQLIVEGGTMLVQTETSFGNSTEVINTKHANISIKVNADLVLKGMAGCNLFKLTPTCSIFSSGEKVLRIISNFDEKRK